jgi:predicted pyridoxine 5'-phosphate oxidase superfamily flavin-nucleotide-binding protein
LDLTFTPKVLAAQRHYYGRAQDIPPAPADDTLGPEERAFIESRDSLYLASVGETGWPYVQHRGGVPGFVQVVSPTEIAFADFKGNRQLLTTGNVVTNDRVCLFLMDYPRRERLKLLGHAEILDARAHPDLARSLARPGEDKAVERVFRVRVVGFDWNCPKYITPRFTAAEVDEVVRPLKQRIAELESLIKKHQP